MVHCIGIVSIPSHIILLASDMLLDKYQKNTLTNIDFNLSHLYIIMPDHEFFWSAPVPNVVLSTVS